jgi:hypothetical protein
VIAFGVIACVAPPAAFSSRPTPTEFEDVVYVVQSTVVWLAALYSDSQPVFAGEAVLSSLISVKPEPSVERVAARWAWKP